MNRVARTLVPLAISLVVAVGLASPARSDQAVVHDRRHDVRITRDGGESSVPRPDIRDPDVVRTRINHSRHRLVIRLRFAALHHGRVRNTQVEVKTPDHSFDFYFQLSHGRKRHWYYVDTRDLRCAHARQDYQIGRDVIRVQIPRSCLRRPSWVRVNASNSRGGRKDDPYADIYDYSMSKNDEHPFTRRLYPG